MKISKKAVDVRLNSINNNFFVAVRYERKWHKVLYSIELCKLLAFVVCLSVAYTAALSL